MFSVTMFNTPDDHRRMVLACVGRLSIFRRRDGRGVRFLRLKDKRVFARQDVVVHQDTMPFRGVGGLVK